ncbi:MAG TPA: ester cyclase [Anaerolineales bacterium]|nr:ester cyclase [Anaerolineales bacterium]
MSTSENKSIVRRYYEEVLNRRQLQVFDEIADPGFLSYLPDGKGIDAEVYKQIITGTFAAIPDLKVTIEDQIAADDKVVTRWKAQGTPQVEFAGIKPNGKSITVTAIHIHRLQNGKLVEHWEAINLHAVNPD